MASFDMVTPEAWCHANGHASVGTIAPQLLSGYSCSCNAKLPRPDRFEAWHVKAFCRCWTTKEHVWIARSFLMGCLQWTLQEPVAARQDTCHACVCHHHMANCNFILDHDMKGECTNLWGQRNTTTTGRTRVSIAIARVLVCMSIMT
jgi:hypothetical protein